MKALISMVDFVEEIKDYVHESHNYDRAIELIFEYSTFLKKPLNLGMFIPVDKNGNILEPLKGCCSGRDCGCMGMPINVSSREEIDKVLQAESKVLFEGFEAYNECCAIHSKHKSVYIDEEYCENHTIQDLINHEELFYLTLSAIKQITG